MADMLEKIKLLQDETFTDSPKVKKLFSTIEEMKSRMEQLLTKLKPEKATASETKLNKKNKTKQKDASPSNDKNTINEDDDKEEESSEEDGEGMGTGAIHNFNLSCPCTK